MEFFAKIFSCRLHVNEQRNLVANLLPIFDFQIDADMTSDGIDVDWRIGRTADCGVHNNGIFKRFARHNVGRLQIFPNHLDRTNAGLIGDLAALAIRSRNSGTTRQCHAKSLGQ